MPKRKSKIRRIVRIPPPYLDAIAHGNDLFSPLYQFENGLRIAINNHLTTCYGTHWWDISLKSKLLNTWNYAEGQKQKRSIMPWIGDYVSVIVLPIHQITLGQLEEIVRTYQSDCIPHVFPSLPFFIGHLECIKRVRNMYAHMFPCISKKDCKLAKREIATLAEHINSVL